MFKKTKKSRVATAALGSLAGIATVASVASVIACGHRSKENAPSNQQVDTSHINLSGVKVFDNGEVQGLPQLPKGVHLDYFLDGQTKVVHNVGDLGQLQSGATLHLQLGADAGYALKGDLHKTSVLIDHHVTSAPAEQDQVLRTLVKVNPGDIAPITVQQGEAPALPKILGGTWVLEGGGTFVPTNYQPGDVVRFNLRAESEEYELSEPLQVSVTVHGVTDDTYQTFATAEVHIFPDGHTAGLQPVPSDAHWHYSAQVAGKEIALDKDGNFLANTVLTVNAPVTITVVADQYYEFSGAIPEERHFQVDPIIVQVDPEAIAPITVRQGETPALPTILGGTWVLEGGGTFVPTNYQPGDVVRFNLRAESEEYELSEPLQVSVTVHGVTDDTYQTFTSAEVHIATNGITTGLPPVPAGAHWRYLAQVAGKEIALDKDGNFPGGAVLTVGETVTITVVAAANYEFSGAIPAGRAFTVKAPRTIVQVKPGDIVPITVRQGEAPALPKIPGGKWVLPDGSAFDPNHSDPGATVVLTLQPESVDYEVAPDVRLSVTIHGVITDGTFRNRSEPHVFTSGWTLGLPPVPQNAHWHYLARHGHEIRTLDKDGHFPEGTTLTAGETVTITVVADANYEFSASLGSDPNLNEVSFTVEQYGQAAARAQLESAHIYADGTTTGLALAPGDYAQDGKNGYSFALWVTQSQSIPVPQNGYLGPIRSKSWLFGRTEVKVGVVFNGFYLQENGDPMLITIRVEPHQ